MSDQKPAFNNVQDLLLGTKLGTVLVVRTNRKFDYFLGRTPAETYAQDGFVDNFVYAGALVHERSDVSNAHALSDDDPKSTSMFHLFQGTTSAQMFIEDHYDRIEEIRDRDFNVLYRSDSE